MSFLVLAVARLKDKELFSRNHICEGQVDLIQLAAQGSLQLDIDLGAAEGDGKAAAALRDSSALRCWLRVQAKLLDQYKLERLKTNELHQALGGRGKDEEAPSSTVFFGIDS